MAPLKRWLARLLGLLERPRSVGFIVGIKLWTYRIHQSVRHSYRLQFGRAIERERAAIAAAAAATAAARGSNKPPRHAPVSRRPPPPPPPPAEAGRWEWRDMARLPAGFIYLEHLTTVYLVLVLWRNLLPEQLAALIAWFRPQMAPHCYSIGHLAAHKSIEFRLETMLAGYLLLWRALMYLRRRPHVFSLYVFLTISERDLARFCALVKRRACNAGLAAAGLEFPLSGQHQSVVSSGGKFASARLRDSLRIQAAAAAARAPDCSSAVERLFRATLCYRVHLESPNELGETLVYRLKPNRTPSAQRELLRHLAKVVLTVSAFFLLVAGALTITLLLQIISPQRYRRLYPACAPPPLDDHDDGDDSSALPLTWHVLLSMAVDSIHTAIIWIETGMSVLISWTSTYFINYDTQLYWRELNRKLEQLHGRAVSLQQARGGLAKGARKEVETESEEEETEDEEFEEIEEAVEEAPFEGVGQLMVRGGSVYERHFRPLAHAGGRVATMASYRRCSVAWMADASSRRLSCCHERGACDRPQRELDNQIQELLVEFYTLSGHIREVDTIVSDIITTSIFVWVSLFAVLGHLAIDLPDGPDQHQAIGVIVGMETFTYFIYTVGCFSLLQLRNSCFRSYKTFCSIMAINESNRKEGLAKLIDYIAGTHCFAYTIFSQYPFTKTTYLSIIGWSFSVFFIVEGVRKQ